MILIFLSHCNKGKIIEKTKKTGKKTKDGVQKIERNGKKDKEMWETKQEREREREKIQENVDTEREVERGENHQEKVLADKIRGNSRYGLICFAEGPKYI